MWIIITFVAFVDTIPNRTHEEYYGLNFYKQLAWCFIARTIFFIYSYLKS